MPTRANAVSPANWTTSSSAPGEASSYGFGATTTQTANLALVRAVPPVGTSATGTQVFQFSERGGFAGASGTNTSLSPEQLQMEITLRMDDWTPATNQAIAARWSGTASNRSWVIFVGPSGNIAMNHVSSSGSGNGMSAPLPAFTDGSTHTLRLTYRRANADGSSRTWTVESLEDGAFVQSGFDKANSGWIARYPRSSTTVPMTIGYAPGFADLGGTILSAEFRDYGTGTPFASLDPSRYNATTGAISDLQGNTFTASNAGTGYPEVGIDVPVSGISGLATGGRAYFGVTSKSLNYLPPAAPTVAIGTPIAVTFGSVTNPVSPGTYASALATYDAAWAVVDSWTTSSLTFLGPTGLPVVAAVAPILSFSISPSASRCGLQSGGVYRAPLSATSAVGELSPTAVVHTAWNLTAGTNAPGGAVAAISSLTPLRNAAGATVPDQASAPQAGVASSAFSVSNTNNGVNTTWRALGTAPAEAAYSATSGFSNQCVGVSTAMSPSTPTGTYTRTIVIVLVPRF